MRSNFVFFTCAAVLLANATTCFGHPIQSNPGYDTKDFFYNITDIPWTDEELQEELRATGGGREELYRDKQDREAGSTKGRDVKYYGLPADRD